MQSNNKIKPCKKQDYFDSNYKINSKKETSSNLRWIFRDNKRKLIDGYYIDIIYAKTYTYYY